MTGADAYWRRPVQEGGYQAMHPHHSARWAAVLLATGLLGGCGSGDATASSSAVRQVATVATGLSVPWGLTFLPDGGALVSERDSGRVLLVTSTQAPTVVGTVPGIDATGEGGLLGLALEPGASPGWLYAYFTGDADNRVARMPWNGSRVGPPEPVLTGIPKNIFHNGGRIAFGPDGLLYVATGDAGDENAAQDQSSLAGKVLRITPEGGIPNDNPYPGSPVFSLGHRNVQGLAFDATGRLWASEFGSKDADELNLLRPGGNYGWPLVEGRGTQPEFINPITTWEPTSTASPSGIAVRDGAVYVASLRGEKLWRVPLTGRNRYRAQAVPLGDLGRLRTVATTPDGRSLWVTTSNRDGRGDPRRDDDRIIVVR